MPPRRKRWNAAARHRPLLLAEQDPAPIEGGVCRLQDPSLCALVDDGARSLQDMLQEGVTAAVMRNRVLTVLFGLNDHALARRHEGVRLLQHAALLFGMSWSFNQIRRNGERIDQTLVAILFRFAALGQQKLMRALLHLAEEDRAELYEGAWLGLDAPNGDDAPRREYWGMFFAGAMGAARVAHAFSSLEGVTVLLPTDHEDAMGRIDLIVQVVEGKSGLCLQIKARGDTSASTVFIIDFSLGSGWRDPNFLRGVDTFRTKYNGEWTAAYFEVGLAGHRPEQIDSDAVANQAQGLLRQCTHPSRPLLVVGSS